MTALVGITPAPEANFDVETTVLPVIVTTEKPYSMGDFTPALATINAELPGHLELFYGEPVNDVRFHAELETSQPVSTETGVEVFRDRLPTFGVTVIRVM